MQKLSLNLLRQAHCNCATYRRSGTVYSWVILIWQVRVVFNHQTKATANQGFRNFEVSLL